MRRVLAPSRPAGPAPRPARPATRPPRHTRLTLPRPGAARAAAEAEAAPQPHFSDLRLDRAAHLRKDPAALGALAASPAAAALLVTPRGEALVVGERGTVVRPAYLPLAAAAALGPPGDPPLFLGLRPGGDGGGGAPVFAVVLPGPDPAAMEAAGLEGARWAAIVSDAGPAADPASAAVLALASGLAAFSAAARFDAASGAPLVAVEGGHARRPVTPGEGGGGPPPKRRPRATRPRVDPAVLVLTTATTTAAPPPARPSSPPAPPAHWALLGRKPAWPPRRYSLLAGFVELGETLEGAAVREVAEESGVEVEAASLAYAGSQPWPFPRSLMVAYEGRARVGGAAAAGAGSGGPCPEDGGLEGPAAEAAAAARAAAAAAAALPPAAPLDGELADVRWFPAAAVADAVAGSPSAAAGLAVPGPHALANAVLKAWAARVSGRGPAPPALPAVNPGATAAGPPRPYLLACVTSPAGGSLPHLVVRARAGVEAPAMAAEVAAEAAAAGRAAEVVGGGWVSVGEAAPGSALTPLTLSGDGDAGSPPRHSLAAAVLAVALPLHGVEVAAPG